MVHRRPRCGPPDRRPARLPPLPAQDQDISATDLLARIEASRNHPYSGYVESLGTLQFPMTDRFTDVGALFGERTRMRVWWRGAADWRVDKVLVAGETDLFHDAGGDHPGSYEAAEPPGAATRTSGCRALPTCCRPTRRPARWPTPTPASCAGCPRARGWAGRPWPSGVPGLAAVEHRPCGPLGRPRDRVAARGSPCMPRADGQAALTPEFLDFSDVTPDGAETSFRRRREPRSTRRRDRHRGRCKPVRADLPPVTLPDSASPPAADRAVGVYGAGVTLLVVIPLRDRAAQPLREQLGSWPGSPLVPRHRVDRRSARGPAHGRP